jgi:hypothetical protein
MKKLSNYLLIVCSLFLSQQIVAQNAKQSVEQTKNAKKEMIRSAADLASGNYRDVITNFFQLALTDLTSADKRFRFSANFFALKLKSNPDADIDTNYIKNKFLINSNFDVDLKTDANFKFQGFGFGYRYAIINKRDISLAKDFKARFTDSLSKTKQIMQSIRDQIMTEFETDPASIQKLFEELNDLWDASKTLGKASPALKKIIKQILPPTAQVDDNYNLRKNAKDIYARLVDSYKQNLLWTFSTRGSTYSDGFIFSNVDFETQATSHITKISKNSNLEFDVMAKLMLVDDTLSLKRDLDRVAFAAEAGFNFVARFDDTQKPWLEFKLSTAYNQFFNGLYAGEEKERFTLNGTLRVRVTDQFWIPVTIKYDPKNANVLGVLGIRANFDWLGMKKETVKN